MRNAMTTRAPGGAKKKILFTPSLTLYPTICFNFGFAGNDDVVADDDEEEDKDDVMKRILTC